MFVPWPSPPGRRIERGPFSINVNRLGVIADDLTGAGDVALAFAAAGLKTEMAVPVGPLPARPGPGVRVWVIDTESRFLPPGAARVRVRRALGVLAHWNPDFFFKKIDSTLRGNVGTELEEFLAAIHPSGPVPFVPAFPKMGRTVVNGRLLVNAVPLHRSPFGRDPRQPARTDRVEAFLGTARGGVVVPDVRSDRDLARCVRGALSSWGARGAAVGSAGLAAALASELKSPKQVRFGFSGRASNVGVVVGSAHPRTAQQADRLSKSIQMKSRQGPAVLDFRAAGNSFKEESGEGVSVVRAPVSRSDSRRVLRRLVQRARQMQQRLGLRHWVVTGGETAFALARRWGARRWRVVGQVERGIPVCVSLGANPHHVILKPGGFGSVNALVRAVRVLRGA